MSSSADVVPGSPKPDASSNNEEEVEEEEPSLHDILETPTKDSTANSASNDSTQQSDTKKQQLQKLLQDCLGITEIGTCHRHANCPVLSTSGGTKITSCRICYAEEKRVGIRPPPSFATVVQQMQKEVEDSSSQSTLLFHSSLSASAGFLSMNDIAENMGEVAAPGTETDIYASLLHFLQNNPSAMESVLKRLNQVQNWTLRQKELQLVQYQLHCQRLQQQVHDLQQQSATQRQTIQTLRRSIQQDLKVIQNLAQQQQLHEEQEEAAEQKQEQQQKSPGKINSASPNKSRTSPMQNKIASVGTVPSPLKHSSNIIEAIPEGASEDVSEAGFETMEEAAEEVVRSENVVAAADGDDDDDDEPTNATMPRPQRRLARRKPVAAQSIASSTSTTSGSFYSSRNIFQSFRGGLLDIPKSPPRVRHDADGEGNKPGFVKRNKLHLNPTALNALQLPERALSRHNSNAVPTASAKEIPLMDLAQLARQLDEVAGGDGRKMIDHHSPEQIFEGVATSNETRSCIPAAPALVDDDSDDKDKGSTADDTNAAGSSNIQERVSDLKDTSNNETPQESSDDSKNNTNNDDSSASNGSSNGAISTAHNKFVFSVTGASCHDKFGDEGTYTGTILVTEGLPHGQGTMDYQQSGRRYEGEWVTGQWHGRGQLWNPNGDSYEGEFYLDARHGNGTYKWDNGDVYVGQFRQDKRHGTGEFRFHNGNVYRGEFCDGMFEGFGRYEFAGGYYEGEWKEGCYDGSGELQNSNGGKYTGEFRQSVAHGFGMEVLPDGTKRRGVWVDGKPPA